MNNRAKQSGAALLAFMLVIVTGASYLLVKKFNENAEARNKDEITLQALNDVKAALIGYAVTFPDRSHSNEDGPGYFPCPDTRPLDHADSGDAHNNCSLTNDTLIGRFPNKRLNIPEIRDSSGERLWLIISNNYKFGAQKGLLNSDVPGTIQINPGMLAPDERLEDIVAVLIAPGEPVDGQNNRNSDSANPEEYLEFTQPDTEEYVWDADTSNDRIVTISRTELMRTVERRVLGDIVNAFLEYKSVANNMYPWLSIFDNPVSSAFKSDIGSNSGHIAYHWSEETDADSELYSRNPFSTAIAVEWEIDNGNIESTGPEDYQPDEECVRESECDDSKFGAIGPDFTIPVDSGECRWQEGIIEFEHGKVSPSDHANCNGEFSLATTETRSHLLFGFFNISVQYDITRVYVLNFQYDDINAYEDYLDELDGETVDSNALYASITVPTETSLRTRSVRAENSPLIAEINVTDSHALAPGSAWATALIGSFSPPLHVGTGSKILTIEPDDGLVDGFFIAGNIRYDMDIERDEMPEWLIKNLWHHYIYVKYFNTDECDEDLSITSLGNIYDPDVSASIDPNDDATYEEYLLSDNHCAIAMIAGAVIDTGDLDQTNRLNPAGSDQLSDYFELLNQNLGDGLFLMQRRGLEFNDQIRIIENL